MDIERLKERLKMTTEKKPIPREDLLSTGSTLLNLAISGDPFGGLFCGGYFFMVGDSSSGKTFLSLTCLAEASINERFDDYRFIYDNAENGAFMSLEKFFGSGVAERIEPPAVYDDGSPSFSDKIEDFYYNVDNALQEDKPFIYVLDSMDSLSSKSEESKFQEHKQADKEGKKAKGDFGDGKAKVNSSGIRRLLTPLRESGSILIILNQTRDNLGFGFETKTRSGGHALKFYSSVEIWSSVKQKITKVVNKKKRPLGIMSQIKVKKNRINGKENVVEVPIFNSFGIDDIGSCVDYLIDEGYWKPGKIEATEFTDKKLSRDKLIELIEEKGMETELRELVGNVWKEIESKCDLKRKKRY